MRTARTCLAHHGACVTCDLSVLIKQRRVLQLVLPGLIEHVCGVCSVWGAPRLPRQCLATTALHLPPTAQWPHTYRSWLGRTPPVGLGTLGPSSCPRSRLQSGRSERPGWCGAVVAVSITRHGIPLDQNVPPLYRSPPLRSSLLHAWTRERLHTPRSHNATAQCAAEHSCGACLPPGPTMARAPPPKRTVPRK